MTGHELRPGEIVRFTSTGQIGVVESVKPGVAHVWVLEWVARTPPVLCKRMCALESLTWIHATDRAGEVWPDSVRLSWRNRIIGAWMQTIRSLRDWQWGLMRSPPRSCR